MRTGERDTKLASAEQAKKKKKKQEEIQSRKPAIYDFNFVYIGNVSMPFRTLSVTSDKFHIATRTVVVDNHYEFTRRFL